MKRRFHIFLLIVALAPLALAGYKQTPTIDDSLDAKAALTPRISPDGRFVVYQVRETNWADNAFETELWIAVVATGDRYQLTNAKKSSTSPAWSPDSSRIAFISDREGKRQLYLIAPAGGEALQITNVETGVNSFNWSPDGRRIAYTAAEPETKTLKDRKERYGDFEVVGNDYTMINLWMVDVAADHPSKDQSPAKLTSGDEFTVNDFSWAPDSSRIAFSAAKTPAIGASETLDIYLLSVDDKSVRKLVSTKGPDRNPVWSQDGKQIAFETSNGRDSFYYANGYIAAVSADGGTPALLTDSFDENPSLLAWSAEGVYFSSQQKTYSHLFRLDPATRAYERITTRDKFSSSQFSFTRDFKQAAFMGAALSSYAEVCVSKLRPFEPRALTAMGDQMKGFRLATREVIEWRSTDGTAIEGILIKPADYDSSKKYPLLVVIHGGPTGVDTPVLAADRTYPLERFVAKGALILRPNYRGSAGYGEKFRSLNVRNLGVGDYWDVISGVDHLIAQGIVDRERVGAMGWSQGGYISAFITTFSDRFKAVSVGAGISDWMTYYANTDIPPFTRQYLKATPWDDPEIYKKTSPISYIKTAKTPTLIQHGEFDKRVPIPNAYELYRALDDHGVPVKMVVYKGFGHGIDKPKQQRAVMEHNYEWFSQWIWGEKPAQEGR